jgi:3-hydroxyisobutyrate dehydrogenase-like beta-hydroxyacid dehydrogenase
MSRERVGLIGAGLMGHGIGKNIVEKGWPLTVVAHRKREPIEDLKGRGAEEARTARELASRSDIVVLCVTGSAQVESLITGSDGLAAAEKPLLVIDCSTSDPSITSRLAAHVSSSGITLVDAPLGRTPKDAWEGTLDVMVGGDPAMVERARPVLDTFSRRIIHTGPTGSGHTMKLLNNFLSMGYAALYSEALMLGAKVGITPQVFDSVIRDGRMDCGFYQTFFKYVLERDREAHRFSLANAMTDMSYLTNLANASGAVDPLAAAVRNWFALAVASGRGEDYVPVLSDIVCELNGVS